VLAWCNFVHKEKNHIYMEEGLNEQIRNIRRDYYAAGLSKEEVPENPFDFFRQWLSEAIKAKIDEPNAFTLSTFDGEFPESRVVLLRDIESGGLSFYTNYNSQKAKSIAFHPKIGANFFWAELFRQLRIRAFAEKLPESISDQYFASRPRESQIGAWASDQSHPMISRKELEHRVEKVEVQFKGKTIPRPKHWGGYLLKPVYFEFWQGRPSRLHDRIVYEKVEETWKIKRLFP